MSCDYLRSAPIRRLPHPLEENPIWSVLGSVISIVVAVALSLPFLLAFLLVLPACLSVRWLLFFIHYGRQGTRPETVGESVRGNDSRWLGSEWRTSVIHAVLVFEAKDGVNVEHFRRLLLKRVIPIYPRLKQRLICLPIAAGGGNCWLTDSEFSIDRHVFSGPSILTNEKELQSYVSKLVEVGLPEDKPPWQLQIFQSFGVSHDTVAVLRVHQSVADGTSLMRLLCHSFADSQVIEIPERPRFGAFAFCMNVFRACIVGPLTLLLWLFLSGGDCNVLTHRSGWTGSDTVAWSASITLPKVIRIKQVTRSTVNCVLLSALAGALRRLLQGCGVKQPPDVKVVVPMDIRSQSSSSSSSVKTTLGNKTSSLTMPLPVAIEGCIPRLWATRKTLEGLKTSADPVILYVATAALMSIGSASFARHLVNILTNKASLQFAFLPGPTSEIFLEGQTLKGIYPILPAQANLGISITTITYADQVFVSVMAEQALGPAAELLLEYLEDQIEILWKLLLNRRVPGEPENPIMFTKTRVSESPIKEIASRLSLVQKEVEHLNESQEKDKDKKLTNLKAEFSELVDEIKRRQSLCETQNSDPSLKPRRRAFSCSTTKKLLNLSPSLHRQEVNLHQFPSNYELIEVNEKKSKEHRKGKIQNVNKSRSETQFNKSAKDESPVKSSPHEGRRHSKSQNVKYYGSKDYKNRVFNTSEKSTSSKYNSNNVSCKNSTRNREHFNLSEAADFNENTQSDTFLEESKRTTCTPRSDKSKQKNKSSETSIIISCSSEGNENITEAKSQTSESESETTMESPSEMSDVIIKVSDVKHENYPTEETGPNLLNCDLKYKNYLEVVKLEDKHLIQVPCQCYEIISQDKLDDSDESDIVGGVLI